MLCLVLLRVSWRESFPAVLERVAHRGRLFAGTAVLGFNLISRSRELRQLATSEAHVKDGRLFERFAQESMGQARSACLKGGGLGLR